MDVHFAQLHCGDKTIKTKTQGRKKYYKGRIMVTYYRREGFATGIWQMEETSE